jgi:hypothetical protein
MNRKQFLMATGVAASGAGISLLLRYHPAQAIPPLQRPWFLAHLFDQDTLRTLGLAYRNANPAEDSQSELTRLLRTAPGMPVDSLAGQDLLSRRLQAEVLGDFSAGHIAVVDGWLLSTTEARQCALFSLASG